VPDVSVIDGAVLNVTLALALLIHPVKGFVIVYVNVLVPVGDPPPVYVTLVIEEVGELIVNPTGPVQSTVSPAYNGLFPVKTKEVLPSQNDNDVAEAPVISCVGAGTIILTSSVPAIPHGPETVQRNT